MSAPRPVAVSARSALRPAVWIIHLAIPLLGLWLLLAQPQLDVIWEDHVSHFWLVVVVAAVNVVLGLWMGAAARDRGDARLFLVSLTFLSSAGFFLLHALARRPCSWPSRTRGSSSPPPWGSRLRRCSPRCRRSTSVRRGPPR